MVLLLSSSHYSHREKDTAIVLPLLLLLCFRSECCRTSCRYETHIPCIRPSLARRSGRHTLPTDRVILKVLTYQFPRDTPSLLSRHLLHITLFLFRLMRYHHHHHHHQLSPKSLCLHHPRRRPNGRQQFETTSVDLLLKRMLSQKSLEPT